MKILTHPLYLAAVPLYARLYASESIVFDDTAPFVKQTFRNRLCALRAKVASNVEAFICAVIISEESYFKILVPSYIVKMATVFFRDYFKSVLNDSIYVPKLRIGAIGLLGDNCAIVSIFQPA